MEMIKFMETVEIESNLSEVSQLATAYCTRYNSELLKALLEELKSK